MLNKRIKDKDLINHSKTITIWRLYTHAMREMFWLVVIFTAFSFLVMNYVQIRDYGWTEWSVFPHLTESLRIFLFFFLLLFLGCLPSTLKGIICIKRQERALGLNFNQEMKKNNITSFYYQDDNWFICITLTRIIVYHQNYIASISRIERNQMSHRIWESSVIGVDDIEVVVRGSEKGLRDLKEWKRT